MIYIAICCALTSLAVAQPQEVEGATSTHHGMRSLEDVTRSTDIPGVYRYELTGENVLPGLLDTHGIPTLPKPHHFLLTPEDAVFIHSSLMGNASHFGATDAAAIYFDSNSYYVVGDQSKTTDDYLQLQSSLDWPSTNFMPAKIVMETGTQINGTNARVYNRAEQQWKAVGFICTTFKDIQGSFPKGTPQETVMNILGPPVSTLTLHRDEPYPITHDHPNEKVLQIEILIFTNDVTELEYFCSDARFGILIENGLVRTVTNNLAGGKRL